MLQQERANIPETRRKLGKSQQRNRRYKELPYENFRTEKCKI